MTIVTLPTLSGSAGTTATTAAKPEETTERFSALIEQAARQNSARTTTPSTTTYSPSERTSSTPASTGSRDTGTTRDSRSRDGVGSGSTGDAGDTTAIDEDDDVDDVNNGEDQAVDLVGLAAQLQALQDANGGKIPGLADIADMLTTVDINLKAGKPLDQALLDKLSNAIDALNTVLALSSEGGKGTPVPADSLLGQFASKLKAMSGALNGQASELAGKLKALGDTLGSGTLDEASLKALGFDKDLKLADQRQKDMLGSLVQTQTTTPPPAVPIAKPALKTPQEPSLVVSAPSQPKAQPAKSDAGLKIVQVEKGPDKTAQDQVKATFGAIAVAEKNIDTSDADKLDQTAYSLNAARAEMNAGVRMVQAAYQSPASPLNMPHLAYEIVRHVQQGSNKFQIRIDPPEMGRVEVTLDIDKSGAVNARLVVEKSETLDLMQRDQRQLEKALAQAGLDMNKTNLEFSLKQNPFAGQGDGREQGARGGFGSGGGDGEGEEAGEIAATTTLYQGTISPSGVNIFV